ncbi:MAG: phenylalanine--tRNA ligase subunit beta, partial [Methylococcales bacterium]
VRLFESGLKFFKQDEQLQQLNVLAGAVTGSMYPFAWCEKNRVVDFFDIKADLEALLGAGRHQIRFITGSHPALHPGQTAMIEMVDGTPVGVVGMLHPELEKQLGLDGHVFLFELQLTKILQRNVPVFAELCKFPAVRRDLAVIVNNSVPAENLVNAIHQSAGNVINAVTIFDVYHGKGVESGYKSVALALILQDNLKTLADTQIDTIVSGILANLSQQFNARLRG